MIIESEIYDHAPHLEGFWEDVQDAFKPPKALRKALERMFTIPKGFRRALRPPKKVTDWVAKHMIPPKVVRKALMKPKWMRKAMERHPWLAPAIEAGITAIGFIPVPGMRIVSVGLDTLNTLSDMGAEVEEIKRETRRAARDEANIIAAEETELARGIPRMGFSTEERIEAMHQLALWAFEQHNLGNFQDAADARLIYDNARFDARQQDMVVLMVFGNPTEILREENMKAMGQGLQEVENVLEKLPPHIPVETARAAKAPVVIEERKAPVGLIALAILAAVALKKKRGN